MTDTQASRQKPKSVAPRVVYAIRNQYTGAAYVGSTRNLALRWKVHLSTLRTGLNANADLQAAWNTDGETAFVLETLQELPARATLVMLNEAERSWHRRLTEDGTPLYNTRFRTRTDIPKVRNWPLSDPQALAELLELHAVARPRILDCTYGTGKVWGHLPVRQSVIKTDIQALPNLDLVADWRALPQHYPAASIDCLVWDPIHVADVGRNSQFYDRYVAPQNPVNGDSVAHLYADFLEVAAQLVKPTTGIVLIKLCDQVHSGRQQWQVMELVAEAQRRGWTACDYTVVQNASGVRKDPKHKTKYHVRNQWAFWIVLRNGPACHGPGRRLKHELICEACGKPFTARRSDAKTHTAACRQQLYEQRRSGERL